MVSGNRIDEGEYRATGNAVPPLLFKAMASGDDNSIATENQFNQIFHFLLHLIADDGLLGVKRRHRQAGAIEKKSAFSACFT